jgi:hypothetical protein
VNSLAARWLAIVAGVVIVAVAIGLYVNKLVQSPTPIAAQQTGPAQAELRLGTTPAVGKLGQNPTWVSYLVREGDQWKHTTVFDVPAHSVVKVTIYNFDGASGLRNPLYARPQGIDGNSFQLDGKGTDVINPDDTSHTFAVPAFGLVVPITGVADDAKNQCGYAPCAMSMAHRTITFTFHTGKAGHYRWQCFVPCAAGWIDGFGGPMQTIGYMDGFIDVV